MFAKCIRDEYFTDTIKTTKGEVYEVVEQEEHKEAGIYYMIKLHPKYWPDSHYFNGGTGIWFSAHDFEMLDPIDLMMESVDNPNP